VGRIGPFSITALLMLGAMKGTMRKELRLVPSTYDAGIELLVTFRGQVWYGYNSLKDVIIQGITMIVVQCHEQMGCYGESCSEMK
jgi:hypothetical protein